MAFQLKDFKSITASMTNWMRASTTKITDFTVGSAARTLVEAPAIEMDQLYQEMFHGLKEAIPVSTYQTFEFDRNPATAATGLFRFFRDPDQTAEPVIIAQGTLLESTVTSVRYATIAEVILEVGEDYVDVAATATRKGDITNANAGAVSRLVANINGIASAVNLTAINGGSDIESADERKLRFQAYITTLARGILPAVKYGAGTAVLRSASGIITESVKYVGAIEPYAEDPDYELPGFVEVFIHNGVGGTTPQLVARAQAVVDGYYDSEGNPISGWKSAGVKVTVAAADEVVVDTVAHLTMVRGRDADTAVDAAERAIIQYLSSIPIGTAAVRHELVERIMAVTGVYDVALNLPAANVLTNQRQKVMAGTITVTAS